MGGGGSIKDDYQGWLFNYIPLSQYQAVLLQMCPGDQPTTYWYLSHQHIVVWNILQVRWSFHQTNANIDCTQLLAEKDNTDIIAVLEYIWFRRSYTISLYLYYLYTPNILNDFKIEDYWDITIQWKFMCIVN